MQTRRLLLIDRDPDFAALLRDNLASYGFDIREVSDEDDPLSRLHEISPELIVIAVELPDKVGYSLCNKAKKGGAKDIPVVLATRSLPPSGFQSHRKLRVHADEYLDKRSLTREELLAAIDGLVGLGESSPFDDDLGIEIEDVEIEDEDDDEMALDEVGEFGPERTAVAPPAAFLGTLSDEADAAFDALGFGDGDEVSEPGDAGEPDLLGEPPLPSPPPAATVALAEDQPAEEAVELDIDDLIDDGPQPAAEGTPEPIALAPLTAPDRDDNTEVAEAPEPPPSAGLEDVLTAVGERSLPPAAPPAMADPAGETLHDVELAASDLAEGGAVETVEEVGDSSNGVVSEMVHDRVPTSSEDDDLDFGLDDVAALAAAEPAPTAPSSEPSPELERLRQDNERLRRELDSSRSDFSRDREVLNLSEIVNKKDRELLDLKEQLGVKSREILSVRERLHEVEADRTRLDEARAALEAKTQELESTITELSEEHVRALANQSSELEASRDAALAELREEHARELQAAKAEAEAQRRTEVEAAEGAAATAVEAERARSAEAVEAERARGAEALEVAGREHETALQSLIDQHAGQLARLEREASEAAEAKATTHAEAIAAAKQANEEALTALRAELEASAAETLAAARSDHAAALAAAENAHAEALGAANATHAAAIAEAESAHSAALATAADARSASENELREQHEADRAALEEAHAAALAAAHAERDELAEKLAARDEAFAAMERELGLSRETVTEREAEIESFEQRVARHEARVTGLEGEVRELEAQNSGYQEQILQAYQRIKTDEATTARAKKALAIALTLLDETQSETAHESTPGVAAAAARGDDGDDSSTSRGDITTS